MDTREARKLLVTVVFYMFLPATSPQALTVVTTADANTLVNSILGSGVTTVGTPTYVGGFTASGEFSDGLAAGVGFESGILLTTGLATDVIGSNSSPGASTASVDLGNEGDFEHLEGIAGAFTFDASVLEFDFQFGDGTSGGNLVFNFAFGSEEYLEFVGSGFNDAFAFIVDEVNIALLPGTADPISVNTVNHILNSAFYRNNVDNVEGVPNLNLDLRYDGMTTTLLAEAIGLSAGIHHIKIAIADAGDGILDSGIFIEGGSFSSASTVPEPGTAVLLGLALVVMSRRNGQSRQN